jgi:aminopeptidase-like protein
MNNGPNTESTANMWNLLVKLYPVYRSLLGPGFSDSLQIIKDVVPLRILEFPSGQRCFDWTIPQEFKVNAAYAIDPDGKKILDFEECSYHLWVYSQPYSGEVTKDQLMKHLAFSNVSDIAIPLKPTYYRKQWGFATSKKHADSLKEGKYKIHIDTELYDGALRIGELFLPGEIEKEIMVTSYLCHPLGANDNLSGVVLCAELYKLLSQLPRRRYSYRFLIWPETIGSIAYNVMGGYVATCVGDPGPFHYKLSFHGDSIFDRAALHVLKNNSRNSSVMPYSHSLGSDECQFNSIGLRLPFGSIMRTPYGKFPQYHTHLDNLSFVTPQALHESLNIYWNVLLALESNRTYKGNFIVDPFLTGHDIYPFNQGAGEGSVGSDIARAYYELMGYVDGRHDLLSIADKVGIPIDNFGPAVKDFLSKKLMDEV